MKDDPKKEMEDDLKKNKNGRQPQAQLNLIWLSHNSKLT
jgi:hypothetical protein